MNHLIFTILILFISTTEAVKSLNIAFFEYLPPLYILTPEKKLSGFAGDMVQHLSKEWNVDIRVQPVHTWQEAITLLENREIDLIPAIGINGNRSETFLFSLPFQEVNLNIYKHKLSSHISSISDLNGLRIGYMRGSIAERYIDKLENPILQSYSQMEVGFLHLLTGDVDAFIYGDDISNNILSRGLSHYIEPIAPPLHSFKRAFMVNKDREGLKDSIDLFLKNYLESSAYIEHLNCWYASPPPEKKYCLIITIIILLLISTVAATLKLVKSWRTLNQERLKYQALFENNVAPFIEANISTGRISNLNNASCKLFKCQKMDLIGLEPHQLHPAHLKDEIIASFSKMISDDENHHLTTTILDRESREIPVQITSGQRYKSGKDLYIIAMFIDLRAVREAEQSAKTEELKFKNLVENIRGEYLIYSRSPDGAFTYISPSVNESLLYHPSELIGKGLEDLSADENSLQILQAVHNDLLNGVNVDSYTVDLRDGAGKALTFEISENAIISNEQKIMSIEGIAHNITLKKQLMELASQQETLESLGNLAGGIAHDFNNLLSGVFSNIELAGQNSKDPETAGLLQQAMQSIEKSRTLTSKLLTFAKGGEPKIESGDLRKLIEKRLKILLRESGHSYKVESEEVPLARFDPSQLTQVIDNIILNAKQAMSRSGHIWVRLSGKVTPTHKELLNEDRDYIYISFENSGRAISKDQIPHIFDPFYSTKAGAHGLGLPTSHSIIKRHGGNLFLEESNEDVTRFGLLIPSATKKDEAKNIVEPARSQQGGVILIMDDEAIIREALSRILKKAGFTTRECSCGEEVVELLIEEPELINDLKGLIFDLIIPGGIGGKDTVIALERFNLKAPIFVCSGYASDPIMAQPEKFGFAASIAKPFTGDEVIKIIRSHQALGI